MAWWHWVMTGWLMLVGAVPLLLLAMAARDWLRTRSRRMEKRNRRRA